MLSSTMYKISDTVVMGGFAGLLKSFTDAIMGMMCRNFFSIWGGGGGGR